MTEGRKCAQCGCAFGYDIWRNEKINCACGANISNEGIHAHYVVFDKEFMRSGKYKERLIPDDLEEWEAMYKDEHKEIMRRWMSRKTEYIKQRAEG